MSVSTQTVQIQGRIIQGHAFKRQPMLDDNQKPLLNEDGSKKTQVFFTLAVPKGQEQDWKMTDWGQQVVAVAKQGYRNGEDARHDFSWKIEDGDSVIPNKKGNKNCDRDGAPGHWLVKCSTQFDVPCFPYGKYSPLDAIRDERAAKTGDYYLASIDFADNTNKGAAAKTPGVYANARATVFIRPGVEIVSAGSVNGEELFAGLVIQGAEQPMASAAPQAAPTPQPQAATPPPAAQVTPAHDMVQQPGAPIAPPAPPAPAPVEKSYKLPDGSVHTESALRGVGYTDAHFAGMPTV